MARVLGVAGQVVQHVAEVDVGVFAQRHEVREADAPRASAQSSMAVTSAPDCETKASSPGSASDVREAGVQPL
jgi:hypothetical protein